MTNRRIAPPVRARATRRGAGRRRARRGRADAGGGRCDHLARRARLLRRVGLALGAATAPLRLKDNPIERRELENGSELFAVSGQVTNPSAARQRVPDIRAELRDAQGRLVYSWTITPQQRTLAPGGAVDFNSAKLDVPANSKRLELSFAGDGTATLAAACGRRGRFARAPAPTGRRAPASGKRRAAVAELVDAQP